MTLGSTNRSESFDDVRKLIREKRVEFSAPSLAVAVARDGSIIWEEGFGWADRENRVPADEHTMYSLASISKPITATGLMILVERGDIDLDGPINDYLGEAKLKERVGGSGEATVRMVANHSSGLPLHYQFFYEDEPYRPPPMDETIRRYGNLVKVPGERYQYSNLGYGVLDHVISRVSGKRYIDFMREEVFVPLGMTHTSVHLGPGLEKFQAVRYGPDGLPIPFYDFDHRGASAVFSSAHDLVRFGLFHLKTHLPDQKAILSDEAITGMQRPTVTIGEGVGYGVGWRVEDKMGYRLVRHGGGMGGVSTSLVLVPSERLALVVLCNGQMWQLTDLVVEGILSSLLPEYVERKSRTETEKEEKEEEQTPGFEPTPELLGRWAGSAHTHEGDIPFVLWFKESGDVHASLGDQLLTLLNDVTFDNGYLRGKMMGDIGTEDANRLPYYLHLELKLRGRVQDGSMIAKSQPGKRAGNALSHWVEVRKQEHENASAPLGES
jgi:CubicO group peptidase (beta-lactamase class C family)